MKAVERKARATLVDRFALAFVSGISGLIVGSLIWFAVIASIAQVNDGAWTSTYRYVLVFAGAMAALGFLVLENFVMNVLGGLLKALGVALRW